jgi:undecaprenyl phosphate N,N'-diacetylbacillosamine 1-phosphate transferase
MLFMIFKRIFDVVLALILVPLVCIITLIVTIVMFFSDKGPVFYNAKRLGRHGIPFTMYKFRTMIVDAPDIRLPDGSTFNSQDDPRITKVGRFLRNASIDEFPQVLNVLIGDMSFIGPRPDPLDWLERYTPEERVFLSVRPGITGYNQAYFRNCADGKTKILNDIYYANNISFSLDFKILIRTIKTIVLRENIYVDEDRKNE